MKEYRYILIVLFVSLGMNANAQQIIDQNTIKDSELINMKQINTPEFEFSPTFYGDGIAFVYSLKKKKSLFDIKTNTSFFDLGFYFPDDSQFPYDSSKKMYRFDEELNSEYHEGPCCFYEDRICYYTREDADAKKARKRKGKTVLQILSSTNTHNIWSESKVMPFCEKKYNYCHPTISSDGNTMIFASDRPGGYGKMDLYVSQKTNGKWSEPLNLGPNINSTVNDWFPFLYEDNHIFYASDKDGGEGGLDIYVSQKGKYSWMASEGLPKPINSSQDDFGFILRQGGSDGYFSSSRAGGKGNDDIYRFITKENIMFQETKVDFMFTMIDSLDKSELENVKMEVISIKTEDRVFDIADYNINLLKSKKKGELLLELSPKSNDKGIGYVSNAFGKVWGVLKKGIPYILSFSKEGYKPYSMVFEYGKSATKREIYLERDGSHIISEVINKSQTNKNKIIKPSEHYNEPEVFIPTVSGSKVTFNSIYYDSNQYKIKPGAAKELDALSNTMHQNPDMKIILNAHTDAIGSESFNLVLSQKRADAAKQYLVRKGISHDRIIAIGIGEAEIINHCHEGVKCSEKEHKINRRTEVEVL